jgi:hypothetical protein
MSDKSSLKGATQAQEGSAIEKQWDESTPMGGFPAENAAMPGARVAQRVDNKYPSAPPGGGDGNGSNLGRAPSGKAKPDVSGFSS